jgi:hypothetical protein
MRWGETGTTLGLVAAAAAGFVLLAPRLLSAAIPGNVYLAVALAIPLFAVAGFLAPMPRLALAATALSGGGFIAWLAAGGLVATDAGILVLLLVPATVVACGGIALGVGVRGHRRPAPPGRAADRLAP